MVPFRLVNGNSSEKIYDCIPDTYAQYVLFHNLETAFLGETTVLQDYMVNKGTTNIDIKVPVNKLVKLYHNTTIFKKVNKNLSYFVDIALEDFYAEIENL